MSVRTDVELIDIQIKSIENALELVREALKRIKEKS